MNSFHMIGHLHKGPEKLENSTSKAHAEIVIECKPNFQRLDEGHTKDIFPIVVWKGLSAQFLDSMKEGDLICVRGRIESYMGSFRFVAELIEDLNNHMINF